MTVVAPRVQLVARLAASSSGLSATSWHATPRPCGSDEGRIQPPLSHIALSPCSTASTPCSTSPRLAVGKTRVDSTRALLLHRGFSALQHQHHTCSLQHPWGTMQHRPLGTDHSRLMQLADRLCSSEMCVTPGLEAPGGCPFSALHRPVARLPQAAPLQHR